MHDAAADRMQEASRRLAHGGEELCRAWRDAASVAFRQERLEPLAREATAMASAMEALAESIDAAVRRVP